ncbi:MAG: proprotein convertase P-domain-containing protein [Planctomycetes bacterium]|nr:proprotein convertase P-domain-containing protein [Planctomycetota bacterium]
MRLQPTVSAALALTGTAALASALASASGDRPEAPCAPVFDDVSSVARPAFRADPVLYSHGDPSDEEQLFMELMNRARIDPVAEADRVFRDYDDPDVKSAVDYFLRLSKKEYSRAENRDAFRSYAPQEPFSFDGRIIAAARKHSEASRKADEQGHQFPGELALRGRFEAEGYIGSALGESTFAFAKSMLQAHAGFAIDWGQSLGSNGRPSLGHRDSLMNYTGTRPYVQCGVGVVSDSSPSTHVGPRIITIDFAQPADASTRFVTGVCYDDRDGDGIYSMGEGLPGVRIESAASSSYTLSSASGGYALPVPASAGTIQIEATGESGGVSALVGHQLRDVTMAGRNVKLDFTAPPEPPVPVAQTFSSGMVALADAATTDAGVSVSPFDPSNPTVGEVDVGIELTHPDASQLKISLRSPAGTEVVLFDHGLPIANLTGTFNDTLAPIGDLATFAGESYQGTWIVRVEDAATGGARSIESCSVRVRPAWVRPVAAARTNLNLTSFKAADTVKPLKDSIRLTATVDLGDAPFDVAAPTHLRLLRADGSEIQRFAVPSTTAALKVKPGTTTSKGTVSVKLTGIDLAEALPSPVTVELAVAGAIVRQTIPLKKGAFNGVVTPPAGPYLRVDLVKSDIGTDGKRSTLVQGHVVGGAVTGLVEAFVGDAQVKVAATSFVASGTKLKATGTGLLRLLSFDTKTAGFTVKLIGDHEPIVGGVLPFALRVGPNFFADAPVKPRVVGTSLKY